MRLPPTDEPKLSVEESTGQCSLFENSTLGIAITNSTFRFLTANPAFLKMLGYSSEELQQQSFLDICIDEDRDEYRVALRELREGARLQYGTETRYQRKDGTLLPVNTYFSAVSGRAPTQLTFLLVTVDITARRAAEDALRAAQSELTSRALEQFLMCLRAGNVECLERLLTSDVTSISDGGGEVSAAANVIRGRDKVLRLVRKTAERYGDSVGMLFCSLNGLPAVLFESTAALPHLVVRFTMHADVDAAGRIRRLNFVLAPSKLTRV